MEELEKKEKAQHKEK